MIKKNLLELKNVSVSFEGFLALNKLNISLKKGELRAIIGPNGAGKTTFLDVITGKVKPNFGEVLFNGNSLIGKKEHKIARVGVGRKFQSPRIFENLTVEENLEISVSQSVSILKIITNQATKEKKQEIEKLLNVINLTNSSKTKAGSLSHGQKQWLEIAMLLGQKPSLMLVDEPVAGLTDEETELTADLLKSLAGTNTVVVIDHDMEFIRRLESDVTVLNQGKVLCEGKMEKIQNDPKVIEVYLGKQEDIRK
ncbi:MULTISPECIES: urea ABC transporter ATP-binding protein UrtD [Prochlorococcus]|uniref:Urea ABC transporter n=1 Tax=Prochlorococcus marinus str. MIT 9116 TaxID=167544 RepID=A0A0A1ZUZ4_PROMR|nr:urea ABC transporter ATP-binding protein UrtD [Prochlorococcus marinus]KGF90856.1 Urea ABC transporter [Prochlorococcus marinus str. MIT 9107]KGF92059.1 Urea ABC transporter [Prochlorococcus marinus str. MIT 9116]KGF93440.1 Urea ABC transporter [Prochlorococcus marinus str. MIT 9123]